MLGLFKYAPLVKNEKGERGRGNFEFVSDFDVNVSYGYS